MVSVLWYDIVRSEWVNGAGCGFAARGMRKIWLLQHKTGCVDQSEPWDVKNCDARRWVWWVKWSEPHCKTIITSNNPSIRRVCGGSRSCNSGLMQSLQQSLPSHPLASTLCEAKLGRSLMLDFYAITYCNLGWRIKAVFLIKI